MRVDQRFVSLAIVSLAVCATALTGCSPQPMSGDVQTSFRRPDGLKATLVAHRDGTWDMHSESSSGATAVDDAGSWTWDAAQRRFVATSDRGTRARVRVSGTLAYVELSGKSKPITIKLDR